jgi:hypothetical protein
MFEMKFTHEEVVLAVQCGQERTNASKHRRDNWGLKNDDPVEDARRQTVGSLGEFALMKLFDQSLTCSVNTFKAPDLVVNGWGIQVKASEHAKNLTIRRDAQDWQPYVLCHVHMGQGDPRLWLTQELYQVATVDILGWIFPYAARLLADVDTTLWRDPQGRKAPAIFIPRYLLDPTEALQSLTQTPADRYDLT